MTAHPTPQPIEAKQFWPALGNRACGVTLVTAQGPEGPAGFLALSVTHLTASPPVLMLSISKTTSALAAIAHSRAFAVNYLGREDEALANMFGGKTELKGADRFDPALWTTLNTGAPALRNAIGVVDCVLDELIERHNTLIALGVIVGFTGRKDGAPLVHFRGAYQ